MFGLVRFMFFLEQCVIVILFVIDFSCVIVLMWPHAQRGNVISYNTSTFCEAFMCWITYRASILGASKYAYVCRQLHPEWLE